MMTKDMPENPYVGPQSFRTGQTLYGRDRETDNLINQLVTERLVLLHAPSGAGKTSLIQAALLPILREMRFMTVGPARVSLLPKSESASQVEGFNRYIYSTLLTLKGSAQEAAGTPPTELDEAGEVALAAETLPDYIEQVFSEMAEPMSLLLIFDQFEEVLTADPLDIPAKEEFFRRLGAALEDQRVWALFSARDDYLGAFANYLPLVPTRLNKRSRLDLLGVEAARDAIILPAGEVGVTFEPEAAQELIESLREIRVQAPDGTPRTEKGPYIEPVLLQVVCHSLWQIPRSDPLRITPQQVEDMGGVVEALKRYFITVVQRVAREAAEAGISGAGERLVRDWIESQLITSTGMRSQVMRGPGRTMGLDNSVIDELIDAFLVRKESRLGSVWYELAHDRLIDPVRVSNKEWRDQQLNPYQKRALQWETQGRPATLLITNQIDLIAYEDWAEANAGELTLFEQQFLSFSQVAAQENERQVNLAAERRANLEDLGWGVIFAENADPRIREALSPLLEHRRRQAGARRPEFYHEFTGNDGYWPATTLSNGKVRPAETTREFLLRHRVGVIQAEPDKMPFYLLIVGDPETIPFEFQYGLDMQYAVGRIYFEKIADYERYARSVVMSESGAFSLPHRAAIFSPTHKGDRATQLFTDKLSPAVLDKARQQLPDWQIDKFFNEQATKEQLAALISGSDAPAFLFAASYSMDFPKDHPDQYDQTGALVCADWPGPGKGKAQVTAEHFYSARDVPADGRLLGSVFFMLSGSTAGKPQLDDFAVFRSNQKGSTATQATEVAPRPFLSQLPKRLLSHPLGGALGVIGHVDLVWAYSFISGKDVVETAVFDEVLRRVMNGHTLGSAMEPFTQRSALVSSELAEKLRQVYFFSKASNREELVKMETQAVDARNYILIGDPAARLPVDGGPLVTTRPTIEPVAEYEEPAFESFEGGAPPEPAPDFEYGAPVEEAPVQQKSAYSYSSRLRGAKAEEDIPVLVNGIDPSTGSYLLPPMTMQQMMAIVLGQTAGSEQAYEQREMKAYLKRRSSSY